MIRKDDFKMISRRLAILLIIKNEKEPSSKYFTIGKNEPAISFRGEIENYCELLSGSNILFDIIEESKLKKSNFYNDNMIRYAAMILTVPFSNISNDVLSLIKEASFKLGISLITAYNQTDERSNGFFGIRSFRGKRILWPLKVKIKKWPNDAYTGDVIANYNLASGVLGIRKRGFRKLSITQSFKKGVRLLRSLIFPYFRVVLEPEAAVLVTNMKGTPLVWSYKFGKATNYYFALYKEIFLDKFNEMHRLVRSAIEENSGFGMAMVDLENTMVLRIDDPGACSADYLDRGGILEEDDWIELGELLQMREITASVMYTPGWVDDGDSRTGRLFLEGKKISKRESGKIYDSARVKYLRLNENYGQYNHESEYRGLKKLAEAGLVDVQSHGLTHLDPFHQSWAEAKDRHKNTSWYREFFYAVGNREVEDNLQLNAMIRSREKINELFGKVPCVITPSAHRQSSNSESLAFDSGFLIFSSDYTAILKGKDILRNWKIPSLFLCLKDPSPFASMAGYPFVGVIHDYEIKNNGLDHFQHIIDGWKAFGVKRFISFNELAISLCCSISAIFKESESRLDLFIDFCNNFYSKTLVSEFKGKKLILRITPPRNFIFSKEDILISGAGLHSINQSIQDNVAMILLTIEHKKNAEISLPLKAFHMHEKS